MVTKTLFGKTVNGKSVYKYTISSSELEVSILSFGATIQSIIVKNPTPVDVVLGYDDVLSYQTQDGYLGATCGRNSNRIENAKFTLNGITYNLAVNDGKKHNLHGGNVGFSHRVWLEEEVGENFIILSLLSKHLEEGFPANLNVKVKFSLDGENLSIEYFGLSDGDTVFNPTNHSYFNLDGHDTHTGHSNLLNIYSNYLTETNEELIPTGVLVNVNGTPLDFTSFKAISKDINSSYYLIENMHGYDGNYCLSSDGKLSLCARAYSQKTGVLMSVYTDRPGVQLYTGYFLTERKGKNGATYVPNSSFCLETQVYPNAVNNPNFEGAFIKANEPFYSKTVYGFAVTKDIL